MCENICQVWVYAQTITNQHNATKGTNCNCYLFNIQLMSTTIKMGLFTQGIMVKREKGFNIPLWEWHQPKLLFELYVHLSHVYGEMPHFGIFTTDRTAYCNIKVFPDVG